MEQQKRKTRVLVVDDHEIIANTLALILNQNGCEASAVYSGEQAVESATRLRPDLLICDVIMGAMSGIEAAIAIGKALPGCEILLMSGASATANLIERARERGHVFEVLAKPLHPSLILDRLNGRAGGTHFPDS